MVKLKLRVIRVENVVLMQVLEQPEEWRGRGLISDTNGLQLFSDNCQALTPSHVFIRGDDEDDDHNVVVRDCGSPADAKDYVEKIKALVEKANATLEPTTSAPESDIEQCIIE